LPEHRYSYRPAWTRLPYLLSFLPRNWTYCVRAKQPRINAIPSMMLTQYSVAYISAQYKVIGVNISSIQNRYLIRIGSLMLLLTLASAAASITVGYLSARVAAGLGRNLRKQLFVRVEVFPIPNLINSPPLL